MRNLFDCLIVGAGPAGIATSLELSKRGWKVLLIDKSAFPREKVCGGFIGPENKEQLERYGVFDCLMAQGAQKITHVFLSAPNGDSVQVPLGRGYESYGLGFSRKMFDEILLSRACSVGVEFEGMTVVKQVVSQDDHYQVVLRNMYDSMDTEIYVRHLIKASGAGSNGVQKRQRLFGVFALFDQCYQMQSNVIMHFISQGHAGINRFERNQINVCYVIKEELFKKFKGDYQLIWNHFLSSNPWMQRQMGDSRRLTPWKTTFIDMDRSLRFYDGTYFSVGDAVGLIHPVAGGGISMALNTGAMLGQLLAEHHPQKIDCQRILRRYRWLWIKKFFVPCAISRWVGAVGHHRRLSNGVIKILQSNQKFVTGLFDLFHHPSMVKELV